MRSRLPILAGLMLAVGVAVLPDRFLELGSISPAPFEDDGHVDERAGGRQTTAVANSASTSAVADTSADGQRLIAQAASDVFAMQSLSALIRLRINMFDQTLTGKGEYCQLGPDEDKLLRLDLRIRTVDREARWLQVCDGRHLWTYQDMPSPQRPLQTDQKVSRVDLRHVRAANNQSTKSGAVPVTPDWLVQGGLAYLLKTLLANFDFHQIHESTLSGVAMWTLRGRWKPKRLTRLRPSQTRTKLSKEPTSRYDLPKHVPHEVVVSLGRNDLFPYRIEFLRRQDGDKSTSASDSIVTMELFEVAMDDIVDPRRFQFQAPADVEVADRTNGYLARLGLRRVE